jgi:phosphoribosylglycinamide formyltransferase-1
MIRLIIFASGSGTNAENIIRYFQSSKVFKITYVLTNNANAGVIKKAASLGVKTRIFTRKELYENNNIITLLKAEANFIILAGFLWKVPDNVLLAFPNRIVNIHPALLPKFGGKGMYGMNIHRAVVANKEEETGITIHYVNEKYDEGAIIFQKKIPVTKNDTAESVADKIHILEQENFPKVIKELLLKEFS